MRNLAIGGGWALAVLLGVALFFVLRPPSPRSFGDCPGTGPGTIHGPPTRTPVADQIVNGPQPGKLKIRYVAAPGICIDGQSGNIHLYGNKTTGGDFTLTFALNLAGQAAWPLDGNKAVQESNNPNGPWTQVPGGGHVASNGAELAFSIPYEAGRNYFYMLQYTNPAGPPDNLQPVEPAIQNH